MWENKNINSIISKIENENKYIEYFYTEIVGLDEGGKYMLLPGEERIYFSIALNKDSKRHRIWNNTLFYFVDKKEIEEKIGRKLKINEIDKIQEIVKNYLKEKNGYLFVRSRLTIVMIVLENEDIRKKDFHVYMWNTKYEFKRISKKINIFGDPLNLETVVNLEEELRLIKESVKESLNCVKAYYDEFLLCDECEENYNGIVEDIENGEKHIVVEGPARSGKTIIAMKLLGKYPDSSLLMMNRYFFADLRDAFELHGKGDFPYERIFHHHPRKNGCWFSVNNGSKKFDMKFKFVIVDEAQRLSGDEIGFYNNKFNEIDKIVDHPKLEHAVFLGDELQKLNEDYDCGIEKIEEKIGVGNYVKHTFSKSIGVPNEVVENIKYLLGVNGSPQKMNDFNIEIYNDVDKFVRTFDEDGSKKRFCNLPFVGIEKQIKSYRNIEQAYVKDGIITKKIYDDEISKNYTFSSYEMISREFESIYLRLPNNVRLIDNEIITTGCSKTKYLLNHLYVLMTRATSKLHILVENDNLFDWFKRKIRIINNCSKDKIDEQDVVNNESEKRLSKVDYVGKKIKHKMYGDGIIEKDEGYKWYINFKGEVKIMEPFHKSIELV